MIVNSYWSDEVNNMGCNVWRACYTVGHCFNEKSFLKTLNPLIKTKEVIFNFLKILNWWILLRSLTRWVNISILLQWALPSILTDQRWLSKWPAVSLFTTVCSMKVITGRKLQRVNLGFSTKFVGHRPAVKTFRLELVICLPKWTVKINSVLWIVTYN